MRTVIVFFSFIYCLLNFSVNMSARPVPKTMDHYFNTIKNNPQEMMQFLKEMPKGGDIHNHLAGAAYAEDLIDFNLTKNFCIDQKTFSVESSNHCLAENKLSAVINNEDTRNALIDAWSMRHFNFSSGLGHDHFFDSFNKFFPAYALVREQILETVVNRAARQHEIYLELMITPDSMFLYSKYSWQGSFEKQRTFLLNEKAFKNNVKYISETATSYLTHLQKEKNNKEVTVKFLYQVMRNQPKAAFFAQLLSGFEAAKINPNIVGVNIVQQEDGYYSIKNYDLEMQMIDYLHQHYPDVHYTLHAGELTAGLVRPNDLMFHIDHAVNIAHAQRIGHGVDIAYETRAKKLLDEMAKKHILVEICLTSNADILGVKGKDHPLTFYLKHHVPVTLATDDEGVLQTDLTREYFRAEATYHFSYQTLKDFARNSITYSFLPGKNLWKNLDHYVPVDVCQKEVLGNAHPSVECSDFLSHNQKAQMQWKLEKQFSAFEQKRLLN